MAEVISHSYGKDNVRLCHVHRDPSTQTHTVTELTILSLLDGDITASYTTADNSVVVPTDTQKQTAYILARQHPVQPIEHFGSILASHYISTYPHIHKAEVKILQHRWTRMDVEGKAHPHSFIRDGGDLRTVTVVAEEGKGVTVQSGIDKLLVLKSTGSAFHGFHKDEYTILKETWDRILSTEIEAKWKWKLFKDLAEVEKEVARFDKAYEAARTITLETFATDESPSVQNTMFTMSEKILATEELVENVSYSLPNKHYFEIDLSWHKGLKNTGSDAVVYAPQSDPNGLIHCTVGRKK